jgi:hypothetical protein
MPPLRGYVVSLFNASLSLPPPSEEEELADVDDPSVASHTFTVRQSGTYRVGVASRNLAGHSEFNYIQHELSKWGCSGDAVGMQQALPVCFQPCPQPPLPPVYSGRNKITGKTYHMSIDR